MAEFVYAPVIRFALSTFKTLGLTLDISGVDNVLTAGGAVVAMNHIGYLDFALAGVPFWYADKRLVRFMAKEQVFHHPVSGPLMRGMKHIPVDRSAGADAYRRAVDALVKGELVGVFPEATISQSFCLKDFKSGAVRMATEARVPVVPVVLWGSQRVWTKNRPRRLRAVRGTHVSITVGKPLWLDDPSTGTDRLKQAMRQLLDDAQHRDPTATSGAPWWLPAHLGGSAPTPEQAAALDAEEAAERRRRQATA